MERPRGHFARVFGPSHVVHALGSAHREPDPLSEPCHVLLAHTTHFNIVDEEFLSAIVLVLSTALLILGHRRRSPTTPWLFYCPVAILMLSVVQSGNTLWGFQFAWYLVLLALSVTLVLCDSTNWNWFVAAGSQICGGDCWKLLIFARSFDMASWPCHPPSQERSEALRIDLDCRCGCDHCNLLCELQPSARGHQ